MNEWGVVLVLSTLVGLFFTVGKPIMTLNKNITTLNVNVENMRNDIQEQKKDLKQQKIDAHSSHEKLWNETSKINDKVADHEKRISVLENT